MKWTVVWHAQAQGELAEIWETAANRAAVTSASAAIDSRLAASPETTGRFLHENLWVVSTGPLRAYFEVLPADRLVRVLNIRANV